jgi:hypothetical protein
MKLSFSLTFKQKLTEVRPVAIYMTSPASALFSPTELLTNHRFCCLSLTFKNHEFVSARNVMRYSQIAQSCVVDAV